MARDKQGQRISNSNKNSNATFAMTHFLKLCYNVSILENKIDARVFRKICVKICYIMLDIALVCVNIKRLHDNFKVHGNVLEYTNGIVIYTKGIMLYLEGILMYNKIQECILMVDRCILKDTKVFECFSNAFGCIYNIHHCICIVFLCI
jgi:hypothetical protein